MSGVWEPLSPAHDTDPPRDPRLPASTYIVCSTPRSGSGLLCRGLAAGGAGGAPAEYFNVNQRVPLSARWGTGPDLGAYVRALRARRCSADGLHGTKLHWDQLEHLCAEALGAAPTGLSRRSAGALLEELFPDARYVRIVRLDIDRQAVSLWTALQCGVWGVRVGAPAPARREVPYDAAAIERCRRFLLEGEGQWDRFFRANRITPIDVVYEDLVERYAETVVTTLTALLGSAPTAHAIPPPDSVPQADAATADLCARFVRDRAAHAADPLGAPAGPPATLGAGAALGVRGGLCSPNGLHTLTLAVDGRLVRHRADGSHWETPTGGHPGARLMMQPDGDLVLRDAAGEVVWRSGTAGHSGARAELQDDGSLVVWSVADALLWSSG
jgi:LPS sulfotransferase NodH